MSAQSLPSPADAAESLSGLPPDEAALQRVAMLVAEGAPPSTVLEAVRATAIATARVREESRSLAEQHEALHRVATLVAQRAEPKAVFTAVAVEASRILGVAAVSIISHNAEAGTLTKIFGTHGRRSAVPDGVTWPASESPEGALVLSAGRPVRIDDYADMPGRIAAIHRDRGFGQTLAAPIIVDGTIWGYLAAYGEADEILPPEYEKRLADFTHLIATAISYMQARDDLRLAQTQDALRRVATLVAQGAEPKTVFTAVAVEASRILGVGAVSIVSYDAETETYTKIFGTHGPRAAVPDGGQWPLADCYEGALMLQTGGPVRIDDWTDIPGPVAARHREQGLGQTVAAPVIVDGGIWGHLAAFGDGDEILPPGCETRLADFAFLMASAISNAHVRDELRGLAERQGEALRRVATLVAGQAPPPVIFSAVAGEASRALGVPRVDVGRCHEDGSLTLLGSTGGPDDHDDHAFSKIGQCLAGKVMTTGRAARIDDWTTVSALVAEAASDEGFGSVVGAPIMVEGALWGVIVVFADEILRDDTETRLTDFTHLVASSIAIVDARNNLIASRARIVTASDETRRQIERNLHDGIQQRLVALGLDLLAVRTRSALPREAREGLDGITRGLEAVLEEIRVFSQGLHPALLARSGLGPSLRELARRSPIPVSVTVPTGPRFSEPVETAVYYVVSEALANAAKHSRAGRISVTVDSDATTVCAVISDDGVGGAALGRSSGLIGLVDRVEALGGRLTLQSPVGRGTSISAELPLGVQVAQERPVL